MSKILAKLFLLTTLSMTSSYASIDIIDNIPAYHNNSRWQKISAKETFGFFFDEHQLKGDETLLDMCSGDGKATSYFANHLPNGHVVGIDASSAMVSFANKNYGNNQVSFKKMDVQKLAFHNQFDVITSFTCLHLIPDIQATFNGVERSLKPNGVILFQFPFDHGLKHALETILKSPRWQPYFIGFEPTWYFHNPEVYKQSIIDAHLEPLRVEITQMHEIYISRGEFQASVGHWLPHVKHLAEPVRDEFMEDLVALYLEYMPMDEKGYLHYYVDRIEIEARKTRDTTHT